jgi:hypothetical protein
VTLDAATLATLARLRDQLGHADRTPELDDCELCRHPLDEPHAGCPGPHPGRPVRKQRTHYRRTK